MTDNTHEMTKYCWLQPSRKSRIAWCKLYKTCRI